MPHGATSPRLLNPPAPATTVSAARARVEAARFSKTVAGRAQAAADAALPLRAILEKLRRVTYATGFDWGGAFERAPVYPEDGYEDDYDGGAPSSPNGLAPYSPPPALACTTDSAFVDILHGCNAAANERLDDAKALEIGAGEYEVLLRRYSDYKGRIRWRRFVKDLAIGAPDDYTDPELRFDALPMPFRMIDEVLNEWLDDVWDAVLAKTGGGAAGSGASSSSAAGSASSSSSPSASSDPANRHMFYPTTISKRVTSNIGEPRFMSPCGSWDLGDRVVIATDAGELIIFDATTDQLLALTTPFPDSAGGITCMSLPRASDSCIASPVNQSEPLVIAVCASAETVADRDARLGVAAEKSRAAAEAAAAAAEAGDAVAADKGKKKGKKGKAAAPADADDSAPADAPDPGGLLALYEVWPRDPIFVPVGNLRAERSITSVALSRESNFMSVTLGDGAVHVYRIPLRPRNTDDGGRAAGGAGAGGAGDASAGDDAVAIGIGDVTGAPLAEVPEGTEGDEGALGGGVDLGLMNDEFARRSRPVTTFDTPLLTLRKGPTDIEVVPPFPVPLPVQTLDRPSTVASEASSVLSSAEGVAFKPEKRLNLDDPPMVHFLCQPTAPDPLLMSTVQAVTKTGAMLVWRPRSNVLRRYIIPNTDAAGIADADAQPDADTDPEAAAAAAARNANAMLVSEWIAPTAITSSALDASDEAIVVGLSDGSVFVLDIHLGCPRCVPRRHVSPKGRGVAVSAVAVYQQQFVVSGAVDGSVMVTDISQSDVSARALSVLASAVQANRFASRGQSRNRTRASPRGGSVATGGSALLGSGPSASASRAGSRVGASRGGTGNAGGGWTSTLSPACSLILPPSQDLTAPVLSIRCMASVPIAVVSTGDGPKGTSIKLYDLVNGDLMGYASPVPVAATNGSGEGNPDGLNDSLWMIGASKPLEWPPMEGFESLPPKDPRAAANAARNAVAASMGSSLFLDRDASSRSLVVVCRDNIFALCNYQGEIPRAPEELAPPTEPVVDAEDAATASPTDADAELAPKPVKPVGPPMRFHRYACGDVLCELFPGIAASCDAGGTAGSAKDQERQAAAKRLFIMSTPDQRRNPNAQMNNLLLGPMGMHRQNNNVPTAGAGSSMASGVGSSVYGSESNLRGSRASNNNTRAQSTRGSRVTSGSRRITANNSSHARISVANSSRAGGKLTSHAGSVGTLGSAGTVSSSALPGGGGSRGIPSVIRGPRANALMPGGITAPRAADAPEVARSFAVMRETRRAHMDKQFNKRHEEFRSVATKH